MLYLSYPTPIFSFLGGGGGGAFSQFLKPRFCWWPVIRTFPNNKWDQARMNPFRATLPPTPSPPPPPSSPVPRPPPSLHKPKALILLFPLYEQQGHVNKMVSCRGLQPAVTRPLFTSYSPSGSSVLRRAVGESRDTKGKKPGEKWKVPDASRE